MRLGSLQLTLVNDGDFRLDGGAMFGVVPKPLWSRKIAADSLNRILMTTNCLLVEKGNDLILIDTGIGEILDEKAAGHIDFNLGGIRLPKSIENAGYALEDVTHVLLTHLHFDHCGWNTRRHHSGWVPTFPRANYWLARGEVDHARNPNQRDRSSYHPSNWEPLFEAGVVELFEDSAEPVSGIRLERAAGHTRDHCIVLLDGGDGEKGAFWADLIPTHAHANVPWIMSYDFFPLQSMEAKQHWMNKAVEGHWIGLFEHDPEVPWGRILRNKRGRFAVEPLDF